MNRLIKSIFVIFAVLVLWYLIRQFNLLPEMVLPGPRSIFETGWEALIEGEFALIWTKSLLIILVVLITCIFGALIFALLADRYRTVDNMMASLSTVLHPLPGVAILPLMIHWFGPGLFSVMAVMVHSVLWPVYLSLFSGIKQIPKVYKQLAMQYELSETERIREVYIPSIMPEVLISARIGWSRAWRSLISAEMIFGAVDGRGAIGWYLFEKRVFGDISGMIFTIIVIMITGIVIEKWGIDYVGSKTVGKWSK